MEKEQINKLIEKQRKFFASGLTKDINFRKEKLISLYNAIKRNEQLVMDALILDLNKSEYEAYMSEVGVVLAEISFVLKNLRKWSKPKKVGTSITQAPGKSFIYYEPYGVALIISPWNYPFQLALAPLIGAISSGNTVIIKPSNYSLHTSKIVKAIIEEVFDEKYVAVVEGGREENTALLEQRFDYIFFTGSVAVGKVVMQAAAKYLTPVTLELGGKSPCIVDETADLKMAARRIVWGKFLNAGQTCIAPDYLLVNKNIKDELLVLMKEEIISFYGPDPLCCGFFPKIISKKHYDRLIDLAKDEEIYYGFGKNGEQIAPTILNNVSWDAPIMQEEIFGPLLPVIEFENLLETLEKVKNREKPLALYLFTKDKKVEKKVLEQISFGGGCINDTVLHFSSKTLPFGGVGNSGMGSYHGKYSFQTFSHKKSILKKTSFLDIPLRYPPFNKKTSFLKRILK